MGIEMKKMNSTVTTIRGKKVPREKVKFIKGKFYEINVDCFLVEGSDKWQRVDNGLIAYNYTLKRWDLIDYLQDSMYVKGYVDDSNTLVYFKLNPLENVLLLESFSDSPLSAVYAFNTNIAESLGYIEHISLGYYYNKKNLNPAQIRDCQKKSWRKYDDKHINYNASSDSSTFMKTVDVYNSMLNVIDISNEVYMASKLLGDKSFGIEYETCDGTIPSRMCDKWGLIPLKDGSLRDGHKEPYEYTSIPMMGARGLATIKGQCNELNKRNVFNAKCSLHLHIGVDRLGESKEFLLAIYILMFNIQEEIYSMFPLYKTDPQKYINAEKNYCKPLKSLGIINNTIYKKESNYDKEKELTVVFDKLFSFLCDHKVDGISKEFNLKSFRHPQGDTKWNRLSRYYIMNLIPTVFSRSRTVEFRLSTPTFNETKVINWLFINMAIVRFAEAYSSEIISGKIKPTLELVLKGYSNQFGKLSKVDPYNEQVVNYLIGYCNDRKEKMKQCAEKGDHLGSTIEFENDKNYQFTDGNLKSIV